MRVHAYAFLLVLGAASVVGQPPAHPADRRQTSDDRPGTTPRSDGRPSGATSEDAAIAEWFAAKTGLPASAILAEHRAGKTWRQFAKEHGVNLEGRGGTVRRSSDGSEPGTGRTGRVAPPNPRGDAGHAGAAGSNGGGAGGRGVRTR